MTTTWLWLNRPEMEATAVFAGAAQWLAVTPAQTQFWFAASGSVVVWDSNTSVSVSVQAQPVAVVVQAGQWTTRLVEPVDRARAKAQAAQHLHVGSCLVADLAGAWATTDWLGGGHVYLGRRGERIALGNRAAVVAAALHDGELPAVTPWPLGWLLSGSRAALGRTTLFAGVELLEPGESVEVAGTAVRHHRQPGPLANPQPNWQGLARGLVERTAQLLQTDQRRWWLGLTGGKDSRLVLAAVREAGLLGLVQCYLRGDAQTADARTAAQLCQYLAIPLVVRPPATAQSGQLLAGLRRHVVQTEGLVHAFDAKGRVARPDLPLVHGHFGELYKSHVQWRFGAVPGLSRRFYAAQSWLDPWGLLQPAVHSQLAQANLTWRDGAAETGWRQHDRWHRECRMHRWVGQALQADASAGPLITPLADRELLAAYLGLSVVDQKAHRVHWELLGQLAPDLRRMGLAQARWSPWLRPGAVAGPVAAGPKAQQPWQHLWGQQEELSSLLFDSANDGFAEVVNPVALQQLWQTTQAKPTLRSVEALVGAAGIRVALQPWQPQQAVVLRNPDAP